MYVLYIGRGYILLYYKKKNILEKSLKWICGYVMLCKKVAGSIPSSDQSVQEFCLFVCLSVCFSLPEIFHLHTYLYGDVSTGGELGRVFGVYRLGAGRDIYR